MTDTKYRPMTAAERFYYGMQSDATPMNERMQWAERYATCERAAQSAGCEFEWSIDDSIDSSDFSDEIPVWSLWCVLMFDRERNVIGALGGVDFGRDGMPDGDPYARFVQGELSYEFFAESE